MRRLEDYRHIISDEELWKIFKKARDLYGKHVIHINSTYQGGGVAEILHALVPLMNDIGLRAGWRILHGNPDFFGITKKFHNALQGEDLNFTSIKKGLYTLTNEDFSVYTHIDHDCVIVHDPQPLPLIDYYQKIQPWIWRCHIDLSAPHKELWDYFKNFLLKYDKIIVSNHSYLRGDVPVEQQIIIPAIDPLSSKNIPLDKNVVNKTIKKFALKTDKPLITQISRFDKWKDQLGVLKVFQLVKEKIDCRLILCGSMASDDPEGLEFFKKVTKKVEKLEDKDDVILLTAESDILVNVLQRISDVIIQKSLREGFGLTVTEALWKGKPVVASNIGGIPLQIKNGSSGFLFEPDDLQGFADRIVDLLKEPQMAESIGKNAIESVRDNFLITRLLSDYLTLLHDFWNGKTCYNN